MALALGQKVWLLRIFRTIVSLWEFLQKLLNPVSNGFERMIVNMDEIILRNGLHLPTLGLGAKIVGRNDKAKYQASYDILHYALQTGKCTLFDTSESYGVHEEILGAALEATGKRDSVRLITKVGNASQRRGGGVSDLPLKEVCAD